MLFRSLNETVDRVGLKYARKVFRDGFVRHRDAFTVHVPTVPLAKLYGDELRGWLARHGVEVREGAAVQSIRVSEHNSPSPPAPLPRPLGAALPLGRGEEDKIAFLPSPQPGVSRASVGEGPGVRAFLGLRDGTTLTADSVILAVPFGRVLDLLPADLAADPFFARIGKLEPSPITSVHVWFDRAVLKWPHVVLVDGLGQWVFNRGEVAPGEHYLQVVVSAARPLKGLGRDEITNRILAELRRLYPAAVGATVIRTKVVTEHAATFDAVPGVDAFRPPQATPVPNLFLAGDYTATGWPATMEGAVRSGYLAAEAVLARADRPERIVQADLGESGFGEPGA